MSRSHADSATSTARVAVGGGHLAGRLDPAIRAALHSIHRTPARRWTVEELGAQAGLSRAAFSRRFTALVGQPPLTYLTW
jgi:transcriptional regulator GlxA family with amidase domain